MHDLSVGAETRMERAFFYTDQNDIDSLITTPSSGMQGTYSPLGISLRNGNPIVLGGGTVIGKYPVVFKYKRTPSASSPSNNRQIGSLDIKFLCKVSQQTIVRSSVKGMEVIVQ